MKRSAAVVFLALFAGVAGAAETVRFITPDGCRLEADYQVPSTGSYVFVTAHGLGSNRAEWGPLETELVKKGYGYLSLDLRGHGGSAECGGAPADYRTFGAAEWSSLSEDIKAAASFLKKKGIASGKLILCGASVGANLSLKAVSEGLRPAGIILLSPGLEYAGIRTDDYFKTDRGVPVFIAVSMSDDYAWRSAVYLTERAGAGGSRAVFRAGAGGHGVQMFASEAPPGMIGAMLDWVKKLKTGTPKQNAEIRKKIR